MTFSKSEVEHVATAVEGMSDQLGRLAKLAVIVAHFMRQGGLDVDPQAEVPPSIESALVEWAGLDGVIEMVKDAVTELSTPLLERQKRLMNAVRKQAADAGVDSITVKGIGTLYQRTLSSASCGDWELFYEWLLQSAKDAEAAGADPREIFAFLNRKVTIDTVDQYMKDHGGEVPPGINFSKSKDFVFRRA